MDALRNMKYSGRGIIAGMTPDGNILVGYTLTGRSKSSQTRKLEQGQPTKTIRTEIINPKQLANGSAALLIYPLIVEVNGGLAASNGIQTELIYSAAARTHDSFKTKPTDVLINAFKEPQWRYDKGDEYRGDRWIDITTYEPDYPNFTPRINAFMKGNEAAMHIVWRGKEGERLERYYEFFLEPGFGQLLTTYRGGNEKPLEHFQGDLLKVEIPSKNIATITDELYDSIRGESQHSDDFRVAVAVVIYDKNKDIEYAIINRSQLSE